jgi:hypothetical protein
MIELFDVDGVIFFPIYNSDNTLSTKIGMYLVDHIQHRQLLVDVTAFVKPQSPASPALLHALVEAIQKFPMLSDPIVETQPEAN